jgi:hypothetical protein
MPNDKYQTNGEIEDAELLKQLGQGASLKINPNRFRLPTTDDFYVNDISQDTVKQLYNSLGSTSKEDCLSYIETPYNTIPGYYDDAKVIIVKATPIMPSQGDSENRKKGDRALAMDEFDGDTVYFSIGSIVDGNKPVQIDGKQYAGLKAFIKGNSSDAEIAKERFGVRFVGVNAPEIPHYILVPYSDDDIIKKKFSDITNNADFLYDHSIDRTSDSELKFIELSNKYYEVVIDNYSDDELRDSIAAALKKNPNNPCIPGRKYAKVVWTDVSVPGDKVALGLKAQKELLALVERSEDVLLMIDHKTINRKSGTYPTEYGDYDDDFFADLWNVVSRPLDAVKMMWERVFGESGLRYLGFNMYGQDAYKRFLGAMYVKVKVEELGTVQWVNVAKYLLQKVGNGYDVLPDYTSNPQENSNAGFIADAFKIWSYNIKNSKIIDSLNEISKQDFDDRRAIQKEVCGIDFDQMKDWTVMIGDCLFIVPPTSIRCVTQTQNERVPILRSRGSMVKGSPKSEKLIEMTLYFNNEDGINGRPYTTKLPNGKDITYYMNGLRTIIAMFKLTPFLPVESKYINSELNIEAVSLVNVQISTMPGYPTCLAAVLTLQEFMYHTYMPEIPMPDITSDDAYDINLFARTINYETMRWYYQRPILNGNKVAEYAFDSKEYLEATFGRKSALVPMKFDSPNIEFYVPDKEYLDQLLKTKIEALEKPLQTQNPITDNAKAWAKQLSFLYDRVNSLESDPNYIAALNDFQGIDPRSGEVIANTNFTAFRYGSKLSGGGKDELLPNLINLFSDKPNNRINVSNYAFGKVTLNNDGNYYIEVTKVANDMKVLLDKVYDKIWEHFAGYAEDLWMDQNYTKSGSTTTDTWEVDIGVPSEAISSSVDRENFLKIMAGEIDQTIDSFYDRKSDRIKLQIKATFTPYKNGNTLLLNEKYELDKTCAGYLFLQKIYNAYGINSMDNSEFASDADKYQTSVTSDEMQSMLTQQKESLDIESAKTLKFIKYPIGNIMIKNISAVFGNTLSKISLKSLDGYAPQYCGGQDTIIEVSIQTYDKDAANMINFLPRMAAQYMRDYRLVLACWPLRINSEITKLLGVNEVLIESVDMSTVPNFPGLYNIELRLMSVDRTVRNQEALKKLDVNNAGSKDIESAATYDMKNFFDLKKKLAETEIYPDLELPTLDELEYNGFKFIRYVNREKFRKYPDPDFYFVYGYTLGHQILRDTVLKFVNENVTPPEYRVTDKYGVAIDIQSAIVDSNENGASGKAYNVVGLNDKAKAMNADKQKIQNAINDVIGIENKKANVGNPDLKNEEIIALYAALEDYQAWNVSDSVKCIFREKQFSNTVADSDKFYVDKIKSRANKITSIIDAYLSSPIDLSGKKDWNSKSFIEDFNDRKQSLNNLGMIIDDTISTVLKDKNISTAISLMDTSIESQLEDADATINQGKQTLRTSILSMMLAAADAASGEAEYSEDSNRLDWECKMFINTEGVIVEKATYKPKNDNDYALIPYCKVDLSNGGNVGVKLASSLEEAMNYGKAFGPFQIRLYDKKEIQTIEDKQINTNLEQLFLDPYYRNKQITEGNDNAEVVEYKRCILMDPEITTIAYFRNMLYWLSKLIKDEILLSIYEVIQNETMDVIKNNINMSDASILNPQNNIIMSFALKALSLQVDKMADAASTQEATKDMTDAQIKEYKDEKEKIEKEFQEQKANNLKLVKSIKDNLEQNKVPIAAGKFFAALTMVLTSGSQNIYALMKDKNYDALNQMVRGAQLPSSGDEYFIFRKFILALVGTGLISSTEKIGASIPTVPEMLGNIINEAVCIAAAEDPRIYIRDSFYDMIINDKRGRMLRAFPTYYMIFVDEGREIGLWKLHDNFYNMSSIAEIQVTKSRKIAADTARIVMTNMFKTYTTDDEDSKEMAMDIDTLKNFQYTWKDVFNSIFSPRTYFMKEELKKMNQLPIERAQIKPGVRMHLRIGYGSDASELPIVFNGVIAEVGTGETVELVAQGDGVELTNPILTTSDAEDIQNQNDFIVGRVFENWLTKGATPRTILGSLLTTKGGWLKKQIFEITSGRFFNQNPYGIVHFGDPMFTDVFQGSECVQNIYEAYNRPSWGDTDKMTDYLQPYFKTKDVPKLSAHVFGKSYWDIMSICAGANPDFIASTIPFGMRSSIFYGAPHYYCAYDYVNESISDANNEDLRTQISSLENTLNTPGLTEEAITSIQSSINSLKNKINNNSTNQQTSIREKRKPFQQFHIYTSYSDIINNCIKTSSKDMRTCAVGLYQGQGAFGRENMERVGPMWVDFDIYPERQKTMTVDTQFLAKGVPVLGDIIPYLNKIIRDVTDSNAYEVAWRITATALKNSVKDMYQGELIVIGDPCVKPYDKMWIEDAYEQMQGCCEVEAVVHNFSVENGYTTSVFADCIATIDDKHEQIVQHIANDVVGRAAGLYIGTIITSWAFAHKSRPLLRLLTSWVDKGVGISQDAVNAVMNFIGKEDLLQNDSVVKVTDKLQKLLGIDTGSYKYNLYMKNLDSWENVISKLEKNEMNSLSDMADYYEQVSKGVKNLNPDDLIKSFTDYSATLTEGSAKQKSAKEAIKKLNLAKEKINSEMAKVVISNEDATELRKISSLARTSGKQTAIEAADIFDEFLKNGGKFDDANEISKFAKSMRTIASNVEDVDELVKGTELAKNTLKSASTIKTAMSVADTTKDEIDKAKDIAKVAKLTVKGGKAAIASTIVGFVLEQAVTTCLVGFAYEWVERWMKNLQVLQVWPLKRNGRVYTAGLDGSRGIVVGSPTADMEGYLEEWIANLFDHKQGDTFHNVLVDIFASQNMQDIASKYRKRNGIPDVESNAMQMEEITQNLLKNIAADEVKRQSGGYKSMLMANRIKDLSSKEEAQSVFNKYKIKEIDTLTINNHIKEDMIAIPCSKDLNIAKNRGHFKDMHDQITKNRIIFNLEGNTVSVGVIEDTDSKTGNKVVDIPFLRVDPYYLLIEIYNRLIDKLGFSEDRFNSMNTSGIYYDDPVKKHQMILHSALRAGDSSWHCTGFGFILEVTDYDLESLLKEIKTESNSSSGDLLEYESVGGSKSKFKIMVHPPINVTTVGGV